jgi:RluA family pseudouridine synthase
MKRRIDKEASLLDCVLGMLGTASRTSVKQIISNGMVKVNGRMVTNPANVLRPGDIVDYEKKSFQVSKIRPPHPLIFEDHEILVSEKPPGLLTIGNKGTGGTSFYQQMSAWVKEKSKGKEQLFIVHRLDREVSGLLLMAKSEVVREKLKENWMGVVKRYYALVQGEPPQDSGTIRTWLAEGADQRVYSTRNEQEGKLAITHYTVMDRTPGFTLCEITLETGRKNQIRVHLSDLGCPVVGDRRYGAVDRFERRIRLHACYLAFKHPVTGKWMEIKSKMPKSFLVLNPENEKYK